MQGGRRRGPGGGSAWSSVTGLMRGFSGLLGSTGRRVESLRSQRRGQLGRSGIGGVGLQRRMSSPVAGLGLKSGEGKARAGETRAHQVSWALGGASAGFWWVVVQRGGGFIAEQRWCAAEQGEWLR